MKALGSGVSGKLADQLPHAPSCSRSASCNLNEDEPAVLLSQVDKRTGGEADNLQDEPSPRFPEDRLRRTSCHCRDPVRAKNSPDCSEPRPSVTFPSRPLRGRWESQQEEEEPGAAGTWGHAGGDCGKRVVSSVNGGVADWNCARKRKGLFQNSRAQAAEARTGQGQCEQYKCF